ncbi:MAG: type II toxin-antitoxin system Phd/YefM family antitoxin [Epsilonproteobacteria bacterium]|nr:type II toxin-antitoxin system Phd/YefM family antitoxin [Campylobacterota bacterium]
MIASAKDLRFNISMLFDLLEKKEEITITYRGKSKAKLIPFRDSKKIEDDTLFGLWSDRDEDVDGYVRDLRRGRSFGI